ncbi:MAG: hypothetical protein QXX12_08250 [Nanopusillaceae archaeon]
MGDNIYFIRKIVQDELAGLALVVEIRTTAGTTKTITPSSITRENITGGACVKVDFYDSSTDEYGVSSISLRRPATAPFPCLDGRSCRTVVTATVTGLTKTATDTLEGTIRFCINTPNPEAITG